MKKNFQWIPWSDVFGVKDNTSAFLIDYAVYIALGMLFAGVAALMVVYMAPYAAGSGIAEVNETKN